MGLEKFIHTLYTDTHSRITRSSKIRIQETVDILGAHEYTLKDSFSAIKSAAALRRRANKGYAGYKTLADTLNSQTQHLISESNNLEAYTMLTQSTSNYITRFENITSYLTQGFYYHDAVQCLDEIRSNSYLKRKAKTNNEFKTQRQTMILELEEYVFECEKTYLNKQPSVWQKAKTAGYAALAAGWGSILTYAAMPF